MSVAAALVAGHRDNIYRRDVVTAMSAHELAGTRAVMNGKNFLPAFVPRQPKYKRSRTGTDFTKLVILDPDFAIPDATHQRQETTLSELFALIVADTNK